MEVIVTDGVNTPKAQVERYLSPILAIFLEEILYQKFSNRYRMIAPEFPIKKGTIDQTSNRPNQSTNIDYLMFNETQNKFTFIELKTDSKSFKPSQLDIYNQLESICNNSEEVFGKKLHLDILEIQEASSYKNKYQYLLDTKWDEKLNSINSMEIVYIVPAATKLKEAQSDLQILYFDDFPQKSALFEKEWQVINSYLKTLDIN